MVEVVLSQVFLSFLFVYKVGYIFVETSHVLLHLKVFRIYFLLNGFNIFLYFISYPLHLVKYLGYGHDLNPLEVRGYVSKFD